MPPASSLTWSQTTRFLATEKAIPSVSTRRLATMEAIFLVLTLVSCFLTLQGETTFWWTLMLFKCFVFLLISRLQDARECGLQKAAGRCRNARHCLPLQVHLIILILKMCQYPPHFNLGNAQKKSVFFLWLCPSYTIVFDWVGSKTRFRQKYWRFDGKGMHGDQDWLTLLSWKMPANFSPLSCAFNHVISMVSFHPKICLWVCKVFQDNEEEIDLSSEAGCERAKIIHRTSSIDNSF